MGAYGVVSNCWRAQLEVGVSLEALIAEAERRGYNHVELRQGCLGAYETAAEGGPRPDAEALRHLPRRFPRLQFNLAMALPYLGGGVTPATPLFEAGLRGAIAVRGSETAHLRLVDTETAPETAIGEEETEARLAALAAACAARGAILSVENARQPWGALRRLLDRARDRLGTACGALRLCYDPCNLLAAADRPDPRVETARLRADEIMLFHLKQAEAGSPLPVVGPGAIDWPAQWAALQQIDYTGPRLFEIPPGPDIWERLDESRRFLKEIGA
jgi:sugar phosphate isomerase/epimerase